MKAILKISYDSPGSDGQPGVTVNDGFPYVAVYMYFTHNHKYSITRSQKTSFYQFNSIEGWIRTGKEGAGVYGARRSSTGFVDYGDHGGKTSKA